MIYVTGDTHGEKDRFSKNSVISKTLKSTDYIIVCGDFGSFLLVHYRKKFY